MRANAVLVVALLAKLAIHLPLASRYGIHRDEYYFLSCGEHLAWGYVDHPPLVALVARLSRTLFGDGAAALRVGVILAGMGAIALAIGIVRELGGGRLAEALTALAMLTSPAMLRMSATLNIPAFELLFWTAGFWLTLRILRGTSSPRAWLAVGAIAGLGLLNKHTMLLWGFGLAVGLVASRPRAQLRRPELWIGAAIAFGLLLPNLLWQQAHGWPTWIFVRSMREQTLAQIGPALFVAGQFLYHNPLAAPLWLLGVVKLWRGRDERPVAITVLVVFATLLVTRAKPYYLTPAYPTLFAAGAVAVADWLSQRAVHVRWGVVAIGALASAPLAVLSLPVLSLPRTDRAMATILAGAVPPEALTHDMHDEYGWREQAETVARVVRTIPTSRHAATRIIAGNYGQASALAYYARALDLPPVLSGHMNHFYWGPGRGDVAELVVFGLPRSEVERLCLDPSDVALVDHALANHWERHLAVWRCQPRAPLPSLWPGLRHFSHGRADQQP